MLIKLMLPTMLVSEEEEVVIYNYVGFLLVLFIVYILTVDGAIHR